jgi:hypothetical protein
VILIPVPAAAGPSWTDIMTAFGTVGAVIVAVGIALWTERRLGKRLKAEQDRSDRLLKEEREHSTAQLEEERRIAREREQLAEAYQVHVVMAQRPAGEPDAYGQPDDSAGRRAVMLVNRGSYTITRIEVRFSYDGQSTVGHRAYRHMWGYASIPDTLLHGWRESSEHAGYSVLTPWDGGLRFETDAVHVKFLSHPYSLVCWTDRWGTRWEHRRGEVRQVRDNEEWAP